MEKYSTSNRLIKNTKDFLSIEYYSFFHKLIHKKGVFYGWGRKKSGLKAVKLAQQCGTPFVLLEDGFIRSVGLGDSPSFSIVEDDTGIYYDATRPSKLENILNSYDFEADEVLMETAREAMGLMRKHRISKYNHAPDLADGFFGDGEEGGSQMTKGNALGCKFGTSERFLCPPGASERFLCPPGVTVEEGGSQIKFGMTGEKFGTSERFLCPPGASERFLCPPGVTGEVDSRLRETAGSEFYF